ncbi:tetratricopeptide repeat protein [Devosia psychrophila]|uniref:Tetratricopeptide repeat-containing protein n=1 Tax=Devosia psychrophila TaxID=728005 RepID=A0A0F5PX93_9HYPH|nr:hypothetical protein [Devosia psychrophila]KKC33258.1 hypothetical protein WH91_09465 [Devosia psychrophila]SFC25017.1 hypothetical protein SAMN04488059_103152 [Devosia psychrophila]
MDVKAFVGHSFTPDDADLIRQFTDYFTQVANMGDGFSWHHAEPAEPAELKQKVIRIFDQCNTFIGICSQKEYAFSPSKRAKAPFQPSKSFVKNDDLSWKTSDWVIQEIGYAVGKGMKVIILLEEGVRPPGGLQGNVEYISFNRASPEKSFGKFLEMLKALRSPDDKAPSSALTVVPTSIAADVVAIDDTNRNVREEHWLDGPISADWDLDKYRFAVRIGGYEKDMLRIDELVSSFSGMSHTKKDKAIFDAIVLSARMENGLGGTLSELRTISDENPGATEIAAILARSLAHFGEDHEAAKIFTAASQDASQDLLSTLEMIRGAGYHFAKAGNANEAWSAIDRLRTLAPTEGYEEQTLVAGAIRDVAEILEIKPLYLASLERLATLAPDNEDTRFQLAYQHSMNGNEDLALVNYVRISPADRGSMTWNNLGVAYGHLDLETLAVDAYQTAHNMGETLATSNLGNQYLKGGFAKIARELSVTALQNKHPHANLIDTLSRAEKAQKNEEATVIRAVEHAAQKASFFKELGTSIVSKSSDVSKSHWIGEKYSLTLASQDSRFSASGSYETEATSGLSGLMISSPTQKVLHKVTIKGSVYGRSVVAKRSVENDRKSQSLFTDNVSKQNVILYFNEAQDVIKLMTWAGEVVETFKRVIASELEG